MVYGHDEFLCRHDTNLGKRFGYEPNPQHEENTSTKEVENPEAKEKADERSAIPANMKKIMKKKL